MEVFNAAANSFWNFARLFISFFDRPVYGLLTAVYQLFFNVASAEIISGEMVAQFYGRVQLIIGVFMLFQLAMIIIKGIMNPDTFTDSKSGAGNVITRIVISLFLLTLLVPINIASPKNEYETKIKNNGLLFGTLYSLQYRVLNNNTIANFVLGTSGDPMGTTDDEVEAAAKSFSSGILRQFYRINLMPGYKEIPECKTKIEQGIDPQKVNACRMCQNISDTVLNTYKAEDADPQDIISMVNVTCNDQSTLESFVESIPVIGDIVSLSEEVNGENEDRYAFNFIPALPTVTGIVLIVVLLGFTIDIAVRAIKLAVLRLIAPIPVISYMDPKGSKDGAFNSWVKTLTSTYLGLFIRIAVVYFIVYISRSLLTNGISLVHGGGLLGGFTVILIIIGLFKFAKDGEKFFKQALGIKDNGAKLFSGIGDIFAAGSVGAGAVSGGISGAASKYQTTSGNAGKKLIAALGGGAVGFVGGGANAGKTWYKQKESDPHAIMNANRAFAMKNYSNASDESTPFGRFAAGAQANLGIKNKFQKMEDQMKYENLAKESLGRMMDSLKSNGDYKSTYNGPDVIDNFGNRVLESGQSYSLKDFNDKLNRVTSSGNESLIAAVDKATKDAQEERLHHLRTTFTGASHAEARARLKAEVDRCMSLPAGHADYKKYTARDLVAFDEAYNIYDVSQLYPEEPFFSDFKGKKFSDGSLKLGVFKGAGSSAGEHAANTKAGSEYAQAKANAQRAEEAKKK